MARFLTGKDLNDALARIIWDAKDTLILISPYIRLDRYFRELLEKHLKAPNLHIIMVFGKNEGQVNKSLSKDDFDFLKQFPNISVVYVANLHAKYYGNEKAGIITSLNLHDHSFDHNIEFGVYSEVSLLGNLANSTDKEAWNYCLEVAHNGIPVFIQRPQFQKNILSALIGKNYVKSEVLLDQTELFYGRFSRPVKAENHLSDFPDEIDFSPTKGNVPSKEMPIKQESKPSSTQKQDDKTGYCIRTGVEIPRDPSHPFSYEAYKEWAEYKNWDYPEKYCHFTGVKTYGSTSFRHPILNDNYSQKQVKW